jgi:hypothetical protein
MDKQGGVTMNIFNYSRDLAYLCIGIAALITSFAYYQNNNIHTPRPQDHDYQILQLGEFRRDQFLIDKKTGRIWHSVCVGELKGMECEGSLMWQEQSVVGLNGYTK